MNRGAAFLDGSRIRTDTLVRHVEIFDVLGSTNDRAGLLAREPALATPALVVARCQTAGRGRGRNTWWAADGALTFSLLVEPAAIGIATANWPQTSLAAAVAVCDALNDCGLRIADCGLKEGLPNPKSKIRNPKLGFGIRWPNDVLVDQRKVCGILIESPGGTAPAKDRLILGIGINVNNSWRAAPPEAGPSGTALCDVTGGPHNLEDLLVGLLRALRERLAQLAAGDEQLRQAWQQLDLLAGHEISVETDGRSTDGTCVGMADDGALVVDTPAGLRRLYSGTVTTLGSAGTF